MKHNFQFSIIKQDFPLFYYNFHPPEIISHHYFKQDFHCKLHFPFTVTILSFKYVFISVTKIN